MTALFCGLCAGVSMGAVFAAIDLPVRMMLLLRHWHGSGQRAGRYGGMIRLMPLLSALGAALGAFMMLSCGQHRLPIPSCAVLLPMGLFFGMLTACLSELLDISARLFHALPERLFAHIGLLTAAGKSIFLYFTLRGFLG